MRITELQLPDDVAVTGPADTEVHGVSHDSRQTQPGWLYAALPGANVHGAQFAPSLITAGVRAILTDPAGKQMIAEALAGDPAAPALDELCLLITESPRARLGSIAAQIYGTDPDVPQLLGVTGTNGKTTTSYILDGLLTALGRTTGLIGTVATTIAGQTQPAVRTTPEAPELHALFARMRSAGVDTCAMEVSSHALAQHRVDGAHFPVAGFTNLSQDHLDFHASMEEYFQAKATLFTPAFSDRGVIMLADDYSRRLAAIAEVPVATISRETAENPTYLIADESGPDFTLHTPAGTLPARAPLPGSFNVANTALALALLLESGTDLDALAAVAGSFEVTVPGRMEQVNGAAPLAVVDYSHTPDAITQVLGGLAESGRPLVIVCGAGGDRDPSKRADMGAAAARGADVVIVTDDNPRSEDPAAIRAAVRSGAEAARASGTARATRIEEIPARSEAIIAGVAAAGETGTLLVAGKGHETGQEIGGVVHPFDDREHTRRACASRPSGVAAGRVQD
ncbi:UDP-N-acetylmuramoyl-L-alanyl-D-glutamate--2,6-diaminopimelate ligase [Brevibacterium luteolum]|uniref:UDP-N-acetylmuramoyl-L-alanyl-D-glutamate--2, 6-diaminopimelate ligase n=1 Tax=Brevibacterium luteolum TaxID=199591 RepID=UPI003879C91B